MAFAFLIEDLAATWHLGPQIYFVGRGGALVIPSTHRVA
jgi:hypothetical protein